MIDATQLKDIITLMRSIGTDIERYEIKTAKKKLPKDLATTLSAFSNGSGGTIILGISEAQGFTPVPGFDPAKMQDALSSLCTTKLHPPVRPHIAIIPFEGSLVLVAHIAEMHPFDKPCYIIDRGRYGGSFIRTGDGDRRLSSYEIDRLIEERRQPRYDADIVEEATMADLDPELVASLLERERTTHGVVFKKLSDTAALSNLRIIVRGEDQQWRPTLGGLMALGVYPQKYFPRLCVTFAVFPGSTKAAALSLTQRLLDSETFVGPIGSMIQETVEAVRKNTRMGSVVEGAFRVDLPDYPPIAVREAVANALMHRDYSSMAQGTPVQVNLYADRLEITNPGGLFGAVTIDQLGKSGISSTRNQYLATILGSTPYEGQNFVVENRGTGYQEIEARLKEARLPPPIPYDSISYFSLTFPRRHLSAAEIEPSQADLNDAILAVIDAQGSASAKEIMAQVGVSRATVSKHLRELMEAGDVEPLERLRSPKQRYRKKGIDER